MTSEITTVDNRAFCQRVSQLYQDKGNDIRPDLVLKVLEDFSDVYLGRMLEKGLVRATWWFTNTFVPPNLVVGNFLQEICACTGLGVGKAKSLFVAMSEAVYFEFRDRNLPNPGDKLLFPPLGLFEVVDLNAGTYYVTISPRP